MGCGRKKKASLWSQARARTLGWFDWRSPALKVAGQVGALTAAEHWAQMSTRDSFLLAPFAKTCFSPKGSHTAVFPASGHVQPQHIPCVVEIVFLPRNLLNSRLSLCRGPWPTELPRELTGDTDSFPRELQGQGRA